MISFRKCYLINQFLSWCERFLAISYNVNIGSLDSSQSFLHFPWFGLAAEGPAISTAKSLHAWLFFATMGATLA